MYLHDEREDVKDLHFAEKSEQEWVAAENGGRVLVILKGKWSVIHQEIIWVNTPMENLT